MNRVAVVGAGTMGNGIAHAFAQHGTSVTLIDVHEAALDKALITIGVNMDRQIQKGDLDAAEKVEALRRIRLASDFGQLDGVDLVVEAATEKRELKFQIFAQLDAVAPPSCILATNTSSISITEIAGHTKRPEQVVGMHFMNPVPVMKLVEVIRGLATSEETVRIVSEAAVSLGKTVAEVGDYPGFVSNRVLMPMINEAIYCLMEGVADRDSIDTVMQLGMNHPLGPLSLADLIGLDTCLAIMEVLQEGFGDDKYRPCPLLRKYVAAGRLGRKSGEGFYTYER